MNTDEEILFLGGPYDGKRRKWESNLTVIKVHTLTFGSPLEDVYRIARFHGRRSYQIAVHESVHDPMLWLIEGYVAKK
jgi:hypothetical protein